MSGRWSRSRSSAIAAVAVAITFMVLIAEKESSHTPSRWARPYGTPLRRRSGGRPDPHLGPLVYGVGQIGQCPRDHKDNHLADVARDI